MTGYNGSTCTSPRDKMSPFTTLFFLSFPLLVCQYCVAQFDPLGIYCNYDTNISTRGQVSGNIDQLLPVLVSKTQLDGYVNSSYGLGKTKIYGLAQCRGDVSRQDCSSCIQRAAQRIRQLCPNQADSRIWYDYCFLRYSLNYFIDQVDTSVGAFLYNVEYLTNPVAFNKKLGALTKNIESQALNPNNAGLGKGEIKFTPFVTIYSLVQCTRDLSTLNCAQCLSYAIQNIPDLCHDTKGCRIIYSSCYFRYEIYPFFFPLDQVAAAKAAGSSSEYVRGMITPN
ncbi:hypothetical protein SAY86_015381 [Trapa natans]|uniref:Gnk2-homologous domain-containing protein n=1 Tax=Trapa natans TaxID=22666 RepID=A0AAN7KP22_TRANT|nr:hypothetical protein SAY86_015381 [Trapa natans]